LNLTRPKLQAINYFWLRVALSALLLVVLSSPSPAQFALAGVSVSIQGPTGSDKFGARITLLPNGNFVVVDPFYDAPDPIMDVGAVYLYNGANGSLISVLTGSNPYDQIGSGGVTLLSNGNYVISSPYWGGDGPSYNGGAATWGSITLGVSGVVSAANSLVELSNFGNSQITVLTNGNYVVSSPSWANGSTINVGAVTWGNGATGTSGVVSAVNSLIGAAANDAVGSCGVTPLNNGNYVVSSPSWHNGAPAKAGAVTWGSGTTGIQGVVSNLNSLVGSSADDSLGCYAGDKTVFQLKNGNYLVSSHQWDNGLTVDAGALTWGSGTTGVSGAISAGNSLVNTGGYVFLTFLENGNYVAASQGWSNGAETSVGAATWGNGTTGTSGVLSPANSLVGSKTGDGYYMQVYALSNSNYVVSRSAWDNGAVLDAGAATWGNGTAGTSGVVSAANSLVGTSPNDWVGFEVIPLTNGNYVVSSPYWRNVSQPRAGAATWGSGTGGITGAVSPANSLVGSSADDGVGCAYSGNGVCYNSAVSIETLSNGNYVVLSEGWNNGAAAAAGAATWGSGTTGVSGDVSPANSLVGSMLYDSVGYGEITELTNGNYVVLSPFWHNFDLGAVTWGSGITGVKGVISAANSLIGSTQYDYVGWSMVTPLSNGNYVVGSSRWSNGTQSGAGAATWGNGLTGIAGTVSAANSLVGSTADDGIGGYITALSNGNYVSASGLWHSGSVTSAGAVTWGNGATGANGAVSAANSLVGSSADDWVGTRIEALGNGSYVVLSQSWNNGPSKFAGAVTWGASAGGISGVVSPANSLVGTTQGDSISSDAFIELTNGSYAILNKYWDQGAVIDSGAVSIGLSGTCKTGPTTGAISVTNSILGGAANGGASLNFVFDPVNHQVVVGRPADNTINLFPTGCLNHIFLPKLAK